MRVLIAKQTQKKSSKRTARVLFKRFETINKYKMAPGKYEIRKNII